MSKKWYREVEITINQITLKLLRIPMAEYRVKCMQAREAKYSMAEVDAWFLVI